MKRITAFTSAFALILTFLSLFSLNSSAEAYTYEKDMPEQLQYGFITASDGAKIEYAIYGDMSAQALVMLPCNGNSMHNFDGSVLPELAKHFKVITVSPRGTGNSERGTEKLTFDTESEDLLHLLDELGIEKTHLFGFSDGGNLAIVFTLQHQDRVLSLTAMGANINTLGTKLTNQIGIVFEYAVLCIKAKFSSDSEVALERDIQGMMVCQPKLKFKDLKEITVPALNIYGESDMMYRCHSKMITKSIPNAQELMVEGGGHSSCFKFSDTIILPKMLDFYGSIGAL